MRLRLAWSLPVAALLGIAISLWVGPHWMMDARIACAFSDDETQRQQAIAQLHHLVRTWQDEWLEREEADDAEARLLQPTAPRSTGLGETILKRLEAATISDGALRDVAGLLKECQQWNPRSVPLPIWLRHTGILLHADESTGNVNPEAASTALMQLAAINIQQEQSIGTEAQDQIQSLWSQLITLHRESEPAGHDDQLISLSLHALQTCAERYGPAAVDPYVSLALTDPNASIQREAWLLLAAADPVAGFAAGEENVYPSVDEAVLWAAATTNPDQAAPLITAALNHVANIDGAIHYPVRLYLLSRSRDPQASLFLADAAKYGQSDSVTALRLFAPHSLPVSANTTEWTPADVRDDLNRTLTLLAAGCDDVERAVQESIAAAAEGSLRTQDMLLRRWLSWYEAPPDGPEVNETLSDPVAADGSVWAAVLLAERLLDEPQTARQAEDWMHSLDDDVKKAGLLLAGLRGTHEQQITQFRDGASPEPVRRAARLALLMIHPDDTSRLEVGRRIADADADNAGRCYDAILALLAGGDPDAVQRLLSDHSDLSPTQRLLLAAWLLERFCPSLVQYAEPLVFCNDRMAALQLDAMLSYWRIHGSSMRYDAQSRVFVPDDTAIDN